MLQSLRFLSSRDFGSCVYPSPCAAPWGAAAVGRVSLGFPTGEGNAAVPSPRSSKGSGCRGGKRHQRGGNVLWVTRCQPRGAPVGDRGRSLPLPKHPAPAAALNGSHGDFPGRCRHPRGFSAPSPIRASQLPAVLVGAEQCRGPWESQEICSVSPGTFLDEQTGKGASGPLFCFNWLLWLLEPECRSVSWSVRAAALRARHRLSAGDRARLRVSTENNLKPRPGRVISGFEVWCFFFSPHLAT